MAGQPHDVLLTAFDALVTYTRGHFDVEWIVRLFDPSIVRVGLTVPCYPWFVLLGTDMSASSSDTAMRSVPEYLHHRYAGTVVTCVASAKHICLPYS